VAADNDIVWFRTICNSSGQLCSNKFFM